MIAVIPRTSGTMLWEPEHRGAQAAATDLGVQIYWNASSREDDVEGQITLVEKVTAGGYAGLILAPDHSLALITPVRRAMASGLPIVIVGSPLPIPPDDRLSYVLNNEEVGAQIAAERTAGLLAGEGSVALLGIDPDIAGIVARASSFEQFLTKHYPKIHIAVRRIGTFNLAHEQQGAEEVLRVSPGLNVIVALTATSTRGAISAIEGSPRNRAVKVIGFDPDSLLFNHLSLDSVIVQDTLSMGERALRQIHEKIQGRQVRAHVEFDPLLVTRENAGSQRVLEMTSSEWTPGSLHFHLRSKP